MLVSTCLQAYNVFSYLVLDLGFSPVTLSVGGHCCIVALVPDLLGGVVMHTTCADTAMMPAQATP